MGNAKIYEKEMTIPTYEVGREEKNPMFFEKRIYQGSSGKVYPNPVTEKISDEKTDKVYRAVVLENDWISVVVLPELGGRIYSAYDKTNGYDFVYKNNVIKPALVGLLGPWISGGIEFNWPQHHRPTTYKAVNYRLIDVGDGNVSVLVGETEAMFGLTQTTEIKLFKDNSYIEIATKVYNGGALPQTFLWWANPAYKVNDDTVTVMPTDVGAVMDHGKRAVSTYPVATGEYYKMDYSRGVDISRYKNILVPTSFMAYKSDFDFIGGYDYGVRAGLLHVADHRVAPGKKQWTWGGGDFGLAWDRNLTDGDGPYIELMTGCFTDNQPDFTFIEPHESKCFTQYFAPYHDVGKVWNADKNLCFGGENGALTLYASAYVNVEITVTANEKIGFSGTVSLSPTESRTLCELPEDAKITIRYGEETLSFDPKKVKNFEIPSAATACPPPAECKTAEELYLYGTHIEQYRHATRIAEDYYLEGLKRDPTDLRLNNAYGLTLFRRGKVAESLPYFLRAVEKSNVKNANPKDTEPYYNAGAAYFYLEDYDNAYEMFYRCLWGNGKAKAYYFLAVIAGLRGERKTALRHAEDCVKLDASDVAAWGLLGRIFRDAGSKTDAGACFYSAQSVDGLDVISRYESEGASTLSHVSAADAKTVVNAYLTECRYAEAEAFLHAWKAESGKEDALVEIYLSYLCKKQGKIGDFLKSAEKISNETVSFGSGLTDLKILTYLYETSPNYMIAYQLGNWHYDKRNYAEASAYWLAAGRLNPAFPTAKRNLAVYFYNKEKDAAKALSYMEAAFELDKTDARVLLELSELYGLCGKSEDERFSLLLDNFATAEARDDLYTEHLSLLNARGEFATAYALMRKRQFHPWEGGEGKVTKLYKKINASLAARAAKRGDFSEARECYERSFSFPHNLGEGKLILDTDNDVWYALGELAETQGNAAEARRCYSMATAGKTEVADDMYYNDNPIDYVYYAALAFKKLGRGDEARRIADALTRYADNHLGKRTQIDYFAVSLPDMLIWEQDIDKRNDEFCLKLQRMAQTIFG